mgnify:CR=1 FL=1
MNKRLLQIVLHNYFTYCLFSIVVCLPIMIYEVGRATIKTVVGLWQANAFSVKEFEAEKKHLKGQGVI